MSWKGVEGSGAASTPSIEGFHSEASTAAQLPSPAVVAIPPGMSIKQGSQGISLGD